MRILYTSVHEILEYDEIRIFQHAGHEVFSLGAFFYPNRPNRFRPAISSEAQDDLIRLFQMTCNHAGQHLSADFLKLFDVAVLMHDPVWFLKNREAFGDMPVIIRAIGQPRSWIEDQYKSLGNRIHVVRYSNRETGPSLAKTDAVIYFGKFLAEYDGRRGGGRGVTFHHNFIARDPHSAPCLEDWHRFSAATGCELWGMQNEEIKEAKGIAPPALQKDLYLNAPWYFYVTTLPPSYTLSVMEAMLYGVPIIAPSVKILSNRKSAPADWTPDRYEVPEMIGAGGATYDTIDEAIAISRHIDADPHLSEQMSREIRARAAKYFDAEKIARQWNTFLSSVVSARVDTPKRQFDWKRLFR